MDYHEPTIDMPINEGSSPIPDQAENMEVDEAETAHELSRLTCFIVAGD